MSKIGLREVVELIENKDVIDLAHDEDLQEFMGEVDDTGGKILRSIPKEQFFSAVTLLQAIVTVDLVTDGEIKMAMLVMSDKTVFGNMMAVALKMSVGLAALEEWR